MRNEVNKKLYHDPRINYRGENASRLDNLTDAVFGIAITLLIFNLSNPNSFSELLAFTATLPAFTLSIAFLMLVWREHLRFSEVYTLNYPSLIVLNTVFIALVIFYVYPLRFLSLFLTHVFFKLDVGLSIEASQVPYLMIYYGLVAFGLYFILFLFYLNAYRMKDKIGLSSFEIFYTKAQLAKLAIMFMVPVLSIIIVLILKNHSYAWAATLGGFSYAFYGPAIALWFKWYKKKSLAF